MFIRLLLSCLVFLITFKLSAANIFVVDSYHADYPWTSDCRQGIETEFGGKHRLTYAEMDTKRIPSSEFIDRANSIWQEIQSTKPNLVITMDDNALKFLGQRISDAGIPLVFMGVNRNPRDYFNNNMIPKNVSGVLERPLLNQNIHFLLPRLLTIKVRKMLLIMDSGVTSEAIDRMPPSDSGQTIERNVQLDVYRAENFNTWKDKITSLSNTEYDALLISSYARLTDENGKQIPAETTANWTSLNSKIPVFAFWRYSVGQRKAIGGYVNSGYKQGELAARIAEGIINSGVVPFVERTADGVYLFSQSELDRWELKLPPNIRSRAEILD